MTKASFAWALGIGLAACWPAAHVRAQEVRVGWDGGGVGIGPVLEKARHAAAQGPALQGKELSEDGKAAAALEPSVERLVENPDGSTTLVGPSLGGSPIAYTVFSGSNSGVCRLFGFERFVIEYEARGTPLDRLVAVSSSGKPYDPAPGTADSNSYPHYYYRAVICARAGAAPTPSRQYEAAVQNPNGTTTFIKPRFDWLGTPSPLLFSIASSEDGICNLFGMKGGMRDFSTVLIENKTRDLLPIIDFDGKLDMLDFGRLVYRDITCAP